MKKELSLNDIHQGTKELLKTLISLCEKLNLNYYIAYGTLIGTVRHKGFIPWDDDCDIVMMRPEYDKLINYCLEHEDELYPYRLLSRKSCKNYPYNIARFNDLRYEAIYENIQKYESGLFIDIYPFDGAGNDKDLIIKKVKKKKAQLFRFVMWAIDDHYEKSAHNKLWRSIIKYFGRLFAKIIGANYFLGKLEKLGKMYSIDESKYVACMIWDSALIIHDKEDFDEYILGEFEGIKVKIPKGYDRVLRNSYGEYMTLPPIEDRKLQHGYKLYKRDSI